MQEMARLLRCTALYFVSKVSQILWVLRDFHRLFGPRNSPTTGILHVRHVYRSVWPAREAKPRFGAALECSAHDCETRSFSKEPRPPSVTSCSIPMGQLTGSILSCKLQLATRCPLQLRVTWHFINTRHEKRWLSNLRCAKDCGWRFARRRHWCVLTWR